MSRRVLVTGGNRGIGLAVARGLAADGDEVVVTYRSGDPPEGLPAVRCDVTSELDVRRAFEEIEATRGSVEVVVANAGITRDGLLAGMSETAFREVVETNLTGAATVARRAVRAMVGARWGRLIFVSSAVALVGSPGQSNYCAAKAGLIGLSRALAWELGSRNITANVVAPGLIDTDMTASLSERRRHDYLRMTPLGRAGRTDEVTAAIRFLASDDAGYVTGAVLPVSGGLGMGL